MMPVSHQLVPMSGHVEESETARKLQLYATSIKTSVSTRLYSDITISSLVSSYAIVFAGRVRHLQAVVFGIGEYFWSLIKSIV